MTLANDIAILNTVPNGQPEVENFNRILEHIKNIEVMADNAHDALEGVLESGEVQVERIVDMLKRGLHNMPQKSTLTIMRNK